jgi:hypothetical protein
MTAVIIADDFRVVEKCDGNAKHMQRAIGGHYEILCPGTSGFEGFVNEEGLVRNVTPNAVGFEVAKRLGFGMATFCEPFIRGPLLITSKEENRSLTAEEVAKIRNIFGEVAAANSEGAEGRQCRPFSLRADLSQMWSRIVETVRGN